eukprot:COSAG05_NODE_80_length_21046_cov_45.708325_9_plen_94_part_00
MHDSIFRARVPLAHVKVWILVHGLRVGARVGGHPRRRPLWRPTGHLSGGGGGGAVVVVVVVVVVARADGHNNNARAYACTQLRMHHAQQVSIR